MCSCVCVGKYLSDLNSCSPQGQTRVLGSSHLVGIKVITSGNRTAVCYTDTRKRKFYSMTGTFTQIKHKSSVEIGC